MLMLAWILGPGGATLVYLASPRQALRTRPLAWPARVAGLLMLLGAGVAWSHHDGPGAGAFAALSCAMLVWVALPYAAWWRGARSERDA